MENKFKFIFLCLESELHRESYSYYKEISKRFNTTTLNSKNFKKNWLDFNSLDIESDLIPILIYPDVGRMFENIHLSPYITICFHIDTFAAIHLRYNIAISFDINVVFHPGYKDKFNQKGIDNVIELYHSVDIEDKIKSPQLIDRNIEIAFVGDIKRSIYSTRKNILNQLNAEFNISGIGSHLNINQILNLYSQSKIVLNISRDDYIEDANLRCFEAMGNRSLLFNFIPSELEQLGFLPDVHFIGFTKSQNWIEKTKEVLKNIDNYQHIADNGWNKTLEYHTYSKMTDRFIKELEILLIPNNNILKSNRINIRCHDKKILLGLVQYWAGHNKLLISAKYFILYHLNGGKSWKPFLLCCKVIFVKTLILILGKSLYSNLKTSTIG